MKRSIFLMACLVCHIGMQAQINHTVTFEPGKLIIGNQAQEDGNVYASLSYEDCSVNDSVGTPSLPYRILRFIVPNEPVSFSIDIDAPGSTRINLPAPLLPIQPPVPTSGNKAENEFVPSSISSPEGYPRKIVQIIDEGYLDGDKRILTVKVTPVQYVATSNQLQFHSSVGFTINYNTVSSRSSERRMSPIASPPRESAELMKMLDFVENKSDISRILSSRSQVRATSSSLNLPVYEYVVITSRSLAPYFKRLVEWKRQKGLNAGIVTMQDILGNASITKDEASNLSDDAGKLRQYLKLAYDNGTRYVFLGGNDSVVPIRYGTGGDNDWNDGNEIDGTKIPADLYYSDLNGNWNVDGDKYLGEKSGDKVDYYPELYVGRLLCKNGTEVENYIYKLLKYEQNPGNGDFGYLKKAFYTQADDMQQGDQARKIAKELIEIFPDSVIFQEKEGYNTSELPTFPTGKNVIDEMNKKYGFCSWFGHGSPANISVASQKTGKGAHYLVIPTEDCWQSRVETGNSFMDLTNFNYPSIAYTISCTTMPFDKFADAHNSINYRYNLGEAFTVGGKFGGAAYLGNTRAGWTSYFNPPSTELEKKFVSKMKSSLWKCGMAEALSKADYKGREFHWLALTHNLVGCPEFEMWTDTPSKFTNASVMQSGTTLNVNTLVDDTNIALKGLFSSNRITIQTGKICTFSNVPKNYVLTFYKHDYLPYISPVYLQNEQVNGKHYITGNKVFVGNHVDKNKGSGDFVLKSGSKLTLDVEEITLDAGTTIELGAEFEVNLK